MVDKTLTHSFPRKIHFKLLNWNLNYRKNKLYKKNTLKRLLVHCSSSHLKLCKFYLKFENSFFLLRLNIFLPSNFHITTHTSFFLYRSFLSPQNILPSKSLYTPFTFSLPLLFYVPWTKKIYSIKNMLLSYL